MEKSIDDIEFRKLVLKMYDEGNNIDDISEILNVKMWLIKSIIFTFSGCLDVEEKINSGKFTKEEDEFIKNNYNKDVSFFIKTLKRQYSCLNSKLFRVKKEIESEIETLEMDESYKPQNSGKKFTEEEIEFIKEAYESGDSIKDISIAMERSKHSIEHIIRNNKFKRREEEIPEGYKRCSRCREIKPIDNFYKKKSSKDGLHCYCKECDCVKRKKNEEKRKNGK